MPVYQGYINRKTPSGHPADGYFCFCRYGVECISYPTSEVTMALVTTDARRSSTNSDLYSNSTGNWSGFREYSMHTLICIAFSVAKV